MMNDPVERGVGVNPDDVDADILVGVRAVEDVTLPIVGREVLSMTNIGDDAGCAVAPLLVSPAVT